jgi:hypothetical protein
VANCASDRNEGGPMIIESAMEVLRARCSPTSLYTPAAESVGRKGSGVGGMSSGRGAAICSARRRGGAVKMEVGEQAHAVAEKNEPTKEGDCLIDLGFEPRTLPTLKFKRLKALAMR